MLAGENLSAAESRVVESAASGVRTDFRERGDVVADGHEWGPERTVRAEVLADLLATPVADAEQARAVGLSGARISGQLDLTALSVARPIVLQECYFQEAVVLAEARCAKVDFSGSRLPALEARQLETRGDLSLDRVSGATHVDVAGARIGGVLSLRETRLARPGAPVVDGERLEVQVSMDCGGLRTYGEMWLSGAHIGGRLSFIAASLANTGGRPALNGEGLRVDQDLLCRSDADGRRFEVKGELRLAGAHVRGQLSLVGARLTNPRGAALGGDRLEVGQGLACETDERGQRFEAEGELRLAGARIGGDVRLLAARLSNPEGSALNADSLEVELHVGCMPDEDGQRFEAEGELRLIGAHVGGQFSLAGARVTNPGGAALSLDGLRVDQGMFCHVEGGHRFETEGELRLLGAQVRGQLNMVGARLSAVTRPALTADGMQLDQSFVCGGEEDAPRFEADGGVRLLGAHVGGQLNLIGARLSNASGDALLADGVQVGDVVCWPDAGGRRFEADGVVRLIAARIGGKLDLSGAALASPSGVVLDFEQGHARRLRLPGVLPSGAVVDLSHAVVSELDDHPEPDNRETTGYRARVTGFSYETLGPGSDGCAERIAWLARAHDGYVPQAYDRLAAVFRQAGREEDAKRVMVAKNVRRRATLGPLGKAASYTLAATVGYGYRTWRAAAALLALVLVGWLVFAVAHPAHMQATRPASQLPEFSALLYSLDVVLPVVDLGQEGARAPSGLAQAWYALSVLAGWLLSLGLVAFLTSRLFRE